MTTTPSVALGLRNVSDWAGAGGCGVVLGVAAFVFFFALVWCRRLFFGGAVAGVGAGVAEEARVLVSVDEDDDDGVAQREALRPGRDVLLIDDMVMVIGVCGLWNLKGFCVGVQVTFSTEVCGSMLSRR